MLVQIRGKFYYLEKYWHNSYSKGLKYMYKVSIEKECSCFKRSNYKATQEFSAEEEASSVASKMAKDMTKEFCKEHGFSVIKEDNNFLIILMN